MRIVIQRVRHASVRIHQELHSHIEAGLLILLGISPTDTEADVAWLVKKIAALRIFPDEQGQMNRSLLDTQGEALVVSQFTLFASYQKGNRPSFLSAARPEQAIPLYEHFLRSLSAVLGREVKSGVFGADMQVDLCNDGPVTICMDTQHKE